MEKMFYIMILLCFTISCATSGKTVSEINQDQENKVKARASFEMNCSINKLKVTPLETFSDGLYKQLGVEGCGKKGVYVQIRPLEWVLNSTSK